MRFTGQVALITAAGAGIGKASAEIMAAEGATVIAVDVKEDLVRAMAVTHAANHKSGRIIPVVGDALDAAKVAETVELAEREHGRIDVLVNAVGGSTIIDKPAATIDELSLTDWQRLIAFNLEGTFLFCNAVVPVMKRQGSGKIVNLASIAGRGLSYSSSSAYARCKGRHCSAHQEVVSGTRAVRSHGQCNRTQRHADGTHPAALGKARSGTQSKGAWPNTTRPHSGSDGSSQG